MHKWFTNLNPMNEISSLFLVTLILLGISVPFFLDTTWSFLCLCNFVYKLEKQSWMERDIRSQKFSTTNSVISSVQSLSCVLLFATPWTAAYQASLSIANSQSLLKLRSIESVMPSSHLILCRPPSPSAPNPSQHQSLFQWVNSLHEVAKVLEFQL